MRRTVLIIILCLVALVGGVQLYVQTDRFAAMIRPYVLGPLQEVLGKDAHIGWIGARFIPLSLEARDIVVPDDHGKPVLAVRKIKVLVNPLPLLFRKVRLPSITVQEPRILAERSKQGEINIIPVAERIRANIARIQAAPSSGYELMLKSITLSDGSLAFLDQGNGAKVAVEGITVISRISREQDDFSLRVMHAKVRASAPAYPDLAGELNASLQYEDRRFRINTISLRTGDTTVSLSGEIGSQQDPQLDLRLTARTGPQTLNRIAQLLKKLRKQPRSSIEASASVRGTLGNPLVDGSLQLSGVEYEGLLLKEAALSFGYRDKGLTLSGDKWKLLRGSEDIGVDSVRIEIGYGQGGLDVRKLEIHAGDLSVAASGRTDPERGFDAAISIVSTGQGRTVALLSRAPLSGPIAVKGYVTGAVSNPQLDGILTAGPLAVRGVRFESAAGRVHYIGKKLSITGADIRDGDARYLFSGSADWSARSTFFDAKLNVIRGNVYSIVALFYQPLPLHFPATGDLSFSGSANDYTGTGRLQVDAGTAYGEHFTKGQVTARLTKGRISFPDVRVEKGSGRVQGTGWIGFDGTYEADIESHGVKLREVDLIKSFPLDGPFDLSLVSSGSFSHPEVEASLEMDQAFLDKTPTGHLSADLQIKNGVLTGGGRMMDDHASVSGRMNLVRPFAWSARASVKADAMDPFDAFGRKDLAGRLKMTVDGNLNLHGNVTDLASISGKAVFDKLSLMVGDYRVDNSEPASILLNGDRLTVASLSMTGPATKFTVTGSTRLMKDVDLTVRGSANLSLVRPLVHELEYTNGTADLRLTVSNDWENPDINGELAVRNGEIKIRDIPQKFSNINGKLAFDRSKVMIESLTSEMGGGTLNASGSAQLEGSVIDNFSTRVAFENVTVHYPEGLAATLSGDLSYAGDSDEQFLSGDVTIRKARYDKRVEWKSMLVDIGKNLQKRKNDTGWIGETQINVRFYGKDNILLQNNLAKVPLDVDVYLRGTVNHPQLLGRLEARTGSVYFRQNEFKILHASADFVDPNRLNPVIDIQAEIMVREYLVRLAVSGSADRAVVTLLANPHLSDSDILTLLALGKTSTELKGKEASVGMSEAASFATGQFQDLFESRARSLTGLDRFQIDPYVSSTRDTSVPRVTVGKEIVQDKVVVTYSSNVGATASEQVFRIEYLLNKNFSLVGERNDIGNTGADIKYRFEFR